MKPKKPRTWKFRGWMGIESHHPYGPLYNLQLKKAAASWLGRGEPIRVAVLITEILPKKRKRK